MKKILLGSSILLIAIGFNGCAMAYKKYGEGVAHKVGYSDFEIGKNKYKVSYAGSVSDEPQKVMEFAYKRAKDLCKEKGFDKYNITNTDMNNKITSSTTTSYGKYQPTFTDTNSKNIYSLDVECN